MAKSKSFSRKGGQVLGADELVENLKYLMRELDPKQQGQKILRPALTRGAQPLADQVKSNLNSLPNGKYSTGNLAENVIVTTSKKQLREKGRYNVLVGIRKKGQVSLGSIKASSLTYYATFVEYGTGRYNTWAKETGTPSRSKGADSPVHQKPQPFFRMALEATQFKTLEASSKELGVQINRVMKKIDAKAKAQKASMKK